MEEPEFTSNNLNITSDDLTTILEGLYAISNYELEERFHFLMRRLTKKGYNRHFVEIKIKKCSVKK